MRDSARKCYFFNEQGVPVEVAETNPAGAHDEVGDSGPADARRTVGPSGEARRPAAPWRALRTELSALPPNRRRRNRRDARSSSDTFAMISLYRRRSRVRESW